MTLEEFRADKSLMLELDRCGAIRPLISVLEDEARKLGHSGRTVGRSADDKIEMLGQIQGANKIVEAVRQCLEVPKPAIREIQSTYGAEEQSAKGKKT